MSIPSIWFLVDSGSLKDLWSGAVEEANDSALFRTGINISSSDDWRMENGDGEMCTSLSTTRVHVPTKASKVRKLAHPEGEVSQGWGGPLWRIGSQKVQETPGLSVAQLLSQRIYWLGYENFLKPHAKRVLKKAPKHNCG
jgi:hypothetical protein